MKDKIKIVDGVPCVQHIIVNSQEPIKYYEVNIFGTNNILEFVRRYRKTYRFHERYSSFRNERTTYCNE
jgi:UDP-glucose 4-epimerase